MNSASGSGPPPPPESTSSGAAPFSNSRMPISSRRFSAPGPRQPRTTMASATGGRAEPSQHLPAIDGDVLPADPAGERREQEQRDLRHLLRPAEPSERDAPENAAVKVRIIRLGPGPRPAGEFDRSRGDTVDPDVLARQCCGLGQ